MSILARAYRADGFATRLPEPGGAKGHESEKDAAKEGAQ
jgi:hypothetical protein